MSYLPDLRRSLVDAAARRRDPAGTHPTPVGARPARPSWRRRGLRLAPAALGVLIAVAIAAVALSALRHHSTSARPPASRAAAVPPSLRSLYATLGVLRRPQTFADLHSPELAQWLRRLNGTPTPVAFLGTPDVALIRRAAQTPWGPVYLIPELPLTARRRAAVERRVARSSGARVARQLAAIRRPAGGMFILDGGGGCCSTAAEVRAGEASVGGGGTRPDGASYAQVVVVVPDGVARVAFAFPASRSYTRTGAIVRHPASTITATVHGNVAWAQVSRLCCDQVPMIWYAANGKVIKRIGNFRTAGNGPVLPAAGPPTAQSRAAQRDPATPNRVTVLPASGGPHTRFTAWWRNLLSFAGYRMSATGPTGAGCRGANDLPQALGGEPTGEDLRGRVFLQPLQVGLDHQPYCPGTYHVSVAVRRGATTYPPFGSATFTVR